MNKVSNLSLTQQINYFILKLIEPYYIRLRNSLQRELNRIANFEAIAEGTRLWKKYRKGKPPAGTLYDGYVHAKLYGLFQRADCPHLKGGRYARSANKDYAVYGHTFPDGTQRIKCMLCPKSWRPGDSDWKEALKMVEQSTNTWSSSEIAAPTNRRK